MNNNKAVWLMLVTSLLIIVCLTGVMGQVQPSNMPPSSILGNPDPVRSNPGQGITMGPGVSIAGGVLTFNASTAGSVAYTGITGVPAVSLLGNSTGSVANVQAIALGTGLAFSGSTLILTGAPTGTVCSGTVALGTSAIAAGSGFPVTTACTGLLSTDNIMLDFNSSPLAITGYIPSTAGMLTILKWPSADTINIEVVNNTATSITPGAITLNYRVVR